MFVCFFLSVLGPHQPFMFYSEAKTCLSEKRVAFVGDSRIRQLFYSFIKIINPERKEEGIKVIMRNCTVQAQGFPHNSDGTSQTDLQI